MTRVPVAAVVLAAAFALTLAAGPARAQVAGPPPPLQISADHMSGSHGPEGDLVYLTGNVRIVRGRTVITAAEGTYDRSGGMVYLTRSVRIVDSTTVITCDEASYSEPEDQVQLSGHVKATDKEATLEAPAATYDRPAGRADLYGGVTGHYKRNQRMVSDRASFFRDSMVVHARGNVRAYDEENHLTMTAREVDYARDMNETEARGEPVLEEKGDDGKMTRITSRLLRLNTEDRVAEAIDSVHVRRDTLQATGNYGLFDDQAQRGWLLGNPKAWDDETSLSGDTLEFRTRGRVIERLLVRGKAKLDYHGRKAGSRGETSMLSGRLLDVYFTDDDIDSLVALGDARNEYVAVAAKGKTAERNVAQGDTIRIYMREGKIDEAHVIGHARGEYHPAVAEADTAAARSDLVSYDAAMIRFQVPKNQIELDRSAHLVYNDLDLKARRVLFDSEKQTLVAEGDPELVDRGEKVDGQLMTYDLETRVGNIYKAQTSYEKGLYHGDRIRKVNDSELQVLGGNYSTCSLDEPHYHFSSGRMKIYLKDKLVARPVVFYLRNVPLMALPFWIFPIRPGRHSGLLLPRFELGFSDAAGRFIRNMGYYWAPNDYFDLTTSADYYSAQPSWVIRAEGYYKLQYLIDGYFRGTHAHDEAAKTEDWDLDADHQQTLSPRTRLSAHASFISSRDYNSSNLYGRTVTQRLNRFMTSNLTLSHSADWAGFNGVFDRRQDLDADNAIQDPDDFGPLPAPPPGTVAPLANLTMSLPSLSVTFPTRSIGSMPLLRGKSVAKSLANMYLSLNTQFLSYYERRAFVSGFLYSTDENGNPDSTTTTDQQVTTRRGLEGSATLTDSRRLLGWINVQPSISGTGVVFDFDELGNTVVPTGVWSASATSSASLYGTFRRRIGPLTGIRHVVVPRASFVFSPEFESLFFTDSLGVRRPRFHGFGGIGVSGARTQRLDFGLDQRLQLRVGQGEKLRRLDNFALLTAGGSYNFLWREQNLAHPLSPVGLNLFVQPPGTLNASANSVLDVYQAKPMRTLSYNLGLSFESRGRNTRTAPDLSSDRDGSIYQDEPVEDLLNNWNLGLAYSYSGGYAGPQWSTSKTINMVWKSRLTSAWGYSYLASYNVNARDFGVQSFSVSRDLHCWVMVFTRTFAPGGDAEYYFRLAAKDQNELYVEKGTRSGSLGGIR